MTPQEREKRRRALEEQWMDLVYACSVLGPFLKAFFKSVTIFGSGSAVLYYIGRWLVHGG